MRRPKEVLEPATDDDVLKMMSAWAGERYVYKGMQAYSMHDLWLRRSQIEYKLDKVVSLVQLRRMVKQGLLHEQDGFTYRRGPVFTTPILFQKMQAELNLTDAERAERTAQSVADEYERGKQDYGDDVWHWAADAGLSRVVQDGITQAVEAGMIRKVHVRGLGMRYVPEDRADAWQEAYDLQQLREANRANYIKGLGEELDELVPRVGERTNYTLTSGQLEAILNLVRPD